MSCSRYRSTTLSPRSIKIGRAHVLNSSHRCISYAVFCLKKKIIENETDDDNARRAIERKGFQAPPALIGAIAGHSQVDATRIRQPSLQDRGVLLLIVYAN